MDDKMRHDKAGTDAAADGRYLSSWDKAADDELSDEELTDATGGLMRARNPSDEDAEPDGRLRSF